MKRPFRLVVCLVVLLLPSLPVFAQSTALNQIVGPVIPLGQSPWPYYDKAEPGIIDELMTMALANKPRLGPKAAGLFEMRHDCGVAVIGPGVSEFQPGDWAVVKWHAPDGPGTGHFVMHVGTVDLASQTMKALDRCGLEPGLKAGTGLEVYHCAVGCRDDVGNYNAGAWGLNAGWGGAGWNYYDTGLAVYRMYLRTGDVKYLTWFRDFMDTWWTWALDQGAVGFNPPRAMSLVSQYVRALDGKPERLPVLHAYMKGGFETSGFAAVTPPKFDQREAGYVLIYLAVGARADADPVRRASYCSMMQTQVPQWIATQRPEGYWDSKNGAYAYRSPGTSPWNSFAGVQGLLRAYDVLHDPAVCNSPTLAAQALASATKATDFMWLYGRADNRGIFYDVEYENAGQDGTNAGLKVGRVSAALGSPTVTGVGTTFTTTFKCNGTDYIGIAHEDGYTWTSKVLSCADETHLVMDRPWGFPGEATTAAVSAQYYQTEPAPTNCGMSLAKTCWSGFNGNPLPGDRNSARDIIWPHGKLFEITGEEKWRTRGDELFSVSYGGAAGGPGFNYPNDPGPCGGPLCDGGYTDWMASLHACAVDPTLPCAPDWNYAAGNTITFTGKRFAQGSGIGGSDNYLAWRLKGSVPPPPPLPVPALTLVVSPNLTVTAPALGAAVAVTYAAPVASGGVPPLTATCTPASGSLFPIAVTTVQCLAGDSASPAQATAASFTVTITAPVPPPPPPVCATPPFDFVVRGWPGTGTRKRLDYQASVPVRVVFDPFALPMIATATNAGGCVVTVRR